MYFTASNWNSDHRERCCYLQVSSGSHSDLGIFVVWVSCCVYCGWRIVVVLSLQREVNSIECIVPKHQFLHILPYCFVSTYHRSLVGYFHKCFPPLCYIECYSQYVWLGIKLIKYPFVQNWKNLWTIIISSINLWWWLIGK